MIVHNGKAVGPGDVIVLSPETQRRFEETLDRVVKPLNARVGERISEAFARFQPLEAFEPVDTPALREMLANVRFEDPAAVSARSAEALVEAAHEQRQLAKKAAAEQQHLLAALLTQTTNVANLTTKVAELKQEASGVGKRYHRQLVVLALAVCLISTFGSFALNRFFGV